MSFLLLFFSLLVLFFSSLTCPNPRLRGSTTSGQMRQTPRPPFARYICGLFSCPGRQRAGLGSRGGAPKYTRKSVGSSSPSAPCSPQARPLGLMPLSLPLRRPHPPGGCPGGTYPDGGGGGPPPHVTRQVRSGRAHSTTPVGHAVTLAMRAAPFFHNKYYYTKPIYIISCDSVVVIILAFQA